MSVRGGTLAQRKCEKTVALHCNLPVNLISPKLDPEDGGSMIFHLQNFSGIRILQHEQITVYKLENLTSIACCQLYLIQKHCCGYY
jgi:hypothetical protein